MTKVRRLCVVVASVLLLAGVIGPGDVEAGIAASGSILGGTIWRTLRVGAGGWITGLDISPDGMTRIVRTDTYGAYIWDDTSARWTQLVTATSMPALDVGIDQGAGVYEIRVAPSYSARLYMAYRGYVYRSDNRGHTWTRTGFARVPLDANDEFRTFGQKMAVDPVDPNVVYVGTPKNGLFVTTDGGATWRPVEAIPKSAPAANQQYPGITGIVFDPASGVTGGKTRIIYAASYGNGVYRSADAGASWTRLEGGPSRVRHGKIAVDGAYYVVGDDGASVWRYSAGVWTDTAPHGHSWSTVVTDPFDPNRIVAVSEGGSLDISRDRGATWSDIVQRPSRENRRVATDIPWLAWTNESYMSAGDMLFDSITRNRVLFAEGIGLWYADIPDTEAPPASITFNSASRGIEQLVTNQVLVPPGGKPVLAAWDRPVFYIDNPDAYPSVHGPDNQNAIVMGWAVDYASSDPSFIVGIFNWWNVEKSGYSEDGGRNWQRFASYPAAAANGKIGGSIAASTPKDIVWAPSNGSVPYYTNDGGVTWRPISIDGNKPGESGWGSGYYLNRHIVAADRVAERTFYIYNDQKGLYRSTDGGATWKLLHSGEIAPWSGFNAKLQAVPDHAGHLFFTSGPQGGSDDHHPATNAFMRSTDGGATWTAVPDVLEVRAFGFGKAPTDYPAIFIAGWVHGGYGIWRSDDKARSWIQIGDYPLGSLADVGTIDGDKTVFGTVYMGLGGDGYVYGSLDRRIGKIGP